MASKLYKLNQEDLKKIGVGALVAVVGALLTYFSETIASVDFGDLTPVVMALWSVVANIVRKFLTNSSGEFGKKE